jgi:hypothetical protein
MAEQLIEGASIYAEARCALPDCRSPLHMVLTFSKGIYLTDTAEQLRDPNQAHSSTWHVECAAGHRVLFPPDTAADDYDFGFCTGGHDDYPSLDAGCQHHDMDRLRAVVMPEAANGTEPG